MSEGNTYERIAKLVFQTETPTEDQIRQAKSALWANNYTFIREIELPIKVSFTV